MTAVVVAHEGESWIPQLISSLEASQRFPDQLVAVDTGSSDQSPQLLRDALGDAVVLDAAADAGFGDAVTRGLEAVEPPTDAAHSWVWLLHDDCAPEPAALERLLATAAADDRIGVVGCRVRAWPRGRRLLEVGVTIAGTGRRRTGLEPGEYDQGQHDTVRDVLSVSSAGMLVRRDVWDLLGGFDRRLPLFRDDADLGWRANRAGFRVVVAPDAVIHHAEAASRGVRPVANTSSRPHQADRQAALYTLLVNCSTLAFPWQLARLTVGTMLRAVGFLLGKLPGAAAEEMRALGHVLARPWALLSARRARRRTATVPPRAVRRLLPRWWSPYSDGAESLLEAGTSRVRERAARTAPLSRRVRAAYRDPAALESGPVDDDAINLPVGVSPWMWVLGHPFLSIVGGLVLAGLLGGRALWGGGLLQGGALLPAPPDADSWWDLYGESWHPVQLGSTDATSPYVALLGAVGSVLLGNAWLVVDLVMLMAVPLCAVGAYIVSGRVVRGIATRVWMTVTYAILPVVTGAVTSGHVGTVVSMVLLPWLLRAALRITESTTWRPVFATALVLSAMVAFAPMNWLVAAVATVPVVALAFRQRQPSLALRSVVALVLPAAVLLPWSWRLLTDPELMLTEAGVVRPGGAPADWTVLFGRLGAPGDAPLLLTAGVLVAAVMAMARSDRRTTVASAWVVLAGSLLVAAAVADRTVGVPGTTEAALPWLGIPVLWAQAAAVVAAGAGADGLATAIRAGSFSWRQPVAALVALVALAAPVAGLAWWLVDAPTGDLTRGSSEALPAYMRAAMEGETQQRVLEVTGDRDTASYRLLVDDGLRLGEDSVLPSDPAPELEAIVPGLLSEATPEDVTALADLGVEYVVLPQPADPAFVAALDDTVGLSRASTAVRRLVGWQLDANVGQVRLVDPDDVQPEITAEVLASPQGRVDTEITTGGEDRRVLVATTTGGFAASLDDAELAPVDGGASSLAFEVGPDAGRLHVEHEGNRSRWLLVQLVVVAGCLLLAAPSLDRRQGIAEVQG